LSGGFVDGPSSPVEVVISSKLSTGLLGAAGSAGENVGSSAAAAGSDSYLSVKGSFPAADSKAGS
jgi:hypothetical protein